MKICIIYYSRTGNTRNAAKLLEEKLKERKADVELVEIEAVKKPGFLKAGRAAMTQKELPIKNTDVDLKKYDKILVGSPTWAGRPAPHIRSFFNIADNYKGKRAGVFSTCSGSIEKPQTGKDIKNYLGEIGLNVIDEILSLQMKKEEIKDGEQNIDVFIKTIMSK
ncbi:MAG: flavodoxin family protein [Candidatus Thermoplasmatota archaeon]|nr:flavodoxin family protein [Candidatus Thermoplasmatota archaeon]